jgi:putative transposase
VSAIQADANPQRYYDWLRPLPRSRAVANAVLIEQIRQEHKESDETYGMRRVRAQLRHDGYCVSRLMQEAGIRGVSRRRSFTVTTERNDRQRPAPDLVNRRFAAAAPNELWVADMTYIPTWCGFLYLPVVLDASSRKVVGRRPWARR